MDVSSLNSWAISAQALDRLAVNGEATRRQRRDLDVAICTLDQMLKKRSSKIMRQKYMTDMEEDCAQVCQMGILSAIRSFDPARGSFSTHVHNQLRAAVGDLKHKMKPESRNIETIVPVQHVSLFTPIGNDESESTIADMVADDQAEATILDNLEMSMIYLQIDRAYSQYLFRSESRRSGRPATASALYTHRINKLRERDIFVRYVLLGETLEVIASSYDITRERVRQISSKVYVDPYEQAKSGKSREPGTLNRYLGMSHVSDECPTGFSEVWDEYVAMAWAEFGRDIRLAPTSLVLNDVAAVEPAVEFHPADSIGILPRASLDAVEVVIEDTSDYDDASEGTPIFVQGELPFAAPAPRTPSMMRRLASVAAGFAIAGSLATAAAAQTSRAIPPDEAESVTTAPQKASSTHSTRAHAPRATARRENLSVVDMRRIVLPSQAYGVVVADYSSVASLRSSWTGVRSGWNMLAGLRPAGVPIPQGRYALVFGPITRGQAEGVCHEAKRRPRQCVVTRFGRAAEKVESASRDTPRNQARS